MASHRVATREEWLAARAELLEREKALTRENDEITKLRLELPWVRIEKEYSFDTEGGQKSLRELFEGRSQLMVYHFMFGPEYEAGCPVCSSGADTYSGAMPHLNARDVTFTCVSRAPLDKLLAYRERLGWKFPWASTGGDSAFNRDFGAHHTQEELKPFLESGNLGPVPEFASRCGTDAEHYMMEAPVLTVFALDDGDVYQTYSTTSRGLEPLLAFYAVLDRAPRGRDESEDIPYWIRRNDEY
jgi:predicted dithiol-disulfide oxidoreductase (DUF899 family)